MAISIEDATSKENLTGKGSTSGTLEPSSKESLKMVWGREKVSGSVSKAMSTADTIVQTERTVLVSSGGQMETCIADGFVKT